MFRFRRRLTPKGLVSSVVLLLLLTCFFFYMSARPRSRRQQSAVNPRVHVFYYAWYGTPEVNGKWLHWNHRYLPTWDKSDTHIYPTGRHTPPEDIGSNYYPALGPYSSWDPKIIRNHFEIIRDAGIGVVAVSWYPPGQADDEGSPQDDLYPLLLDVANEYGLQLTFHIEPFKNRTAETLRGVFEHLHSSYGSHPALYRVRRLPLYYLYDSYQVSPTEWRRVLGPEGDLSIRGGTMDAICMGLFLSSKDIPSLVESGMDGGYTYFASEEFTEASTGQNWKGFAETLHERGLLFSPSVGPGYIDTRIRPWNSRNVRERSDGAYYRQSWENAMEARPDFISVTSFNEWGEGTQIEPAKKHSSPAFEYLFYRSGDEEDSTLYVSLTNELVQRWSVQ